MFFNFLKFGENKIKKGSSYAVLRGDYYGEIFVYFKKCKNIMYFVSIPKMEIREVDENKFNVGIKEKILEFVDIVPKEVYKVVESHGKNTLRSLNSSNEQSRTKNNNIPNIWTTIGSQNN